MDEDPGRHAEGDQVGERVVLDAERTRRARPAGHPPVEHVAQLRDKDHDRGEPILLVEGADDRVESGDEPARGEQVRHDVHPAPEGRYAPAPARDRAEWRVHLIRLPHLEAPLRLPHLEAPLRLPHLEALRLPHLEASHVRTSATGDVPAWTRSPARTTGTTPAGR